ncbi:MAG TPA: sigma factor [Opitutaceae bacterium]
MANCEFSEGTKRLLRDHPAYAPEHTRSLAGRFVTAQGEVGSRLAALGYPLERVAAELKAGHLPYFREGSDQDRKRGGEKKSSYRFAGFAPSHAEEMEAKIAERRSRVISPEAYQEWQASFLLRFTFDVIEQVALRAFPPPAPGSAEAHAGATTAARGRLAEALMAARRVRDDIVIGNLLLVAKIVIQRARMHPTVLADDLFAAGSDGLLIAAGRYDPSVGQFSTYATPWISMAIDRFIAKTRHVIRLPIGLQDKLRRERRSTANGELPAGRLPLIPQVQSLEEALPGSDGEMRLEDVVADPAGAAPLAQAEHRDIAGILNERLAQLDDLKRFIIAMRSDVGDAAALGAQLFREEAALSRSRGRGTAAAASRLTDEPARIRMIRAGEAARPAAQPVPIALEDLAEEADLARAV